MSKGIIKIEGGKITDTIYELDQPWFEGEIMWNVTRALFDALHGRFGPPVVELWTTREINRKSLDMKKVAMFRKIPEALDAPGIVVGVMDLMGREHRVFIDGNHRAAARLLNKTNDLVFWFIPVELEGEYRVTIELVKEME